MFMYILLVVFLNGIVIQTIEQWDTISVFAGWNETTGARDPVQHEGQGPLLQQGTLRRQLEEYTHASALVHVQQAVNVQQSVHVQHVVHVHQAVWISQSGPEFSYATFANV